MPVPPEPSKRRTLLVVDDEEGPRQSINVIFKDHYEVLQAASGAEAIELVRNHSVDVAVLDIRMAGMSGIELLERIKAIDPTIEVIMFTAYETVDTIRQALRLGACDYLNKPFDVATMRRAIGSAMERRSISEEIRANNQKLTALQLELQKHKLQEELSRTRGEIYASIIHDINGPLTIISGFVQIIYQRIGDANQVEGEDLKLIKDRLKRIIRQVTNCIEISQRYLNIMRQHAGPRGLVKVNQLLQDLADLLNAHPSKQQNDLRIAPMSEDVVLHINGTDLIQILLNLAINALQSTADRHWVEIKGQFLPNAPHIEQIADSPTDRVINRTGFKMDGPVLMLSVADNGPGIKPDLLPKIFEPYFTTKSPGRGTGLGLSIVSRLIKEAQGALHVHSRAGEGTVFKLYLPAWMPSASPTP
jgi:two-component system, sensor histidine kinase and response regulator